MKIEKLDEENLVHLSNAVNAEVDPVVFLGIDPGKSNGICGYDAKHYLKFMYTVMEPDYLKFLDVFQNVTHAIIENYLLFPNKAKDQIYSDMMTPRIIGRTEGWAARNGVELIPQGASIKATGYAWIGKKPRPKSDPSNHEWDAHVHFMYWAIKNGRINAADLL